MHKTVLTRVRAMLSQSLLPTKYHSGYLSDRLKRTASKPSPYELIYGKSADLTMLVPFCCVGYAFVPPEKRSKLEQIREECWVIGCGDDDGT